MAVVVEGKNSFFISDRAYLLDGDHETASEWASKLIVPNPAYKYIVGKYVEANKANLNRQYWDLDQLRLAQPTISHSPMNLLHDPRAVVGTFIATEMMYPTEEASTDFNPYVEALGVFWSFYFPDVYKQVQNAHALGDLAFSMECVSKTVTCSGDNGCGQTYAYDGPRSMTYCSHLNEGKSIKHLGEPHFLAGALIMPPAKPGWPDAKVISLSSLTKEQAMEAEKAYEGFKAEFADLSPSAWESMMQMVMNAASRDGRGMAQYMDTAATFTPEQRKKYAKSGVALPDGSFPIRNAEDLRNAINDANRLGQPPRVIAHIKKRAEALGLIKSLPPKWSGQ